MTCVELHATPLPGGHFSQDKTLSLALRSPSRDGVVAGYAHSPHRIRADLPHVPAPASRLTTCHRPPLASRRLFPLPVPSRRRGGCISLDFLELLLRGGAVRMHHEKVRDVGQDGAGRGGAGKGGAG